MSDTNPARGLLDTTEIFQHVYNESIERIRVDTNASITVVGEVVAEITAASGDNIAIASQDGTLTAGLQIVGGQTGLNVDVINFPTNQIISGSVAIVGGAVSSSVSGTVSTNLNGLNTFQTSQYSISTSSIQITPVALPTRSSVSLKAICTANNAIYIGNSSSVSSIIGYPLFNGDAIQLDITPAQNIFAISGASGQTLCAIELGS